MVLNFPEKNWWETDQYTLAEILSPEIYQYSDSLFGPKDHALVRVYEDGQTQKGWGITPPKNESEGFMPRYMRGDFLPRRATYGYDKGQHAVAIVMRSVRAMCVDIDGKNGGLEYASTLGALPPTASERSKSGNGYHLFYSVPDEWDDELGFDLVQDAIGIVQGVDIRGVGCVYHYPQQRWNARPLAPAPQWLLDKMAERRSRREAFTSNLSKIHTLDETEILIMQSELLDELAKPIPAGKRNTSLFAIGHKMAAAGVENWETHLTNRALDLGLTADEVERIVRNIGRYDAP